MNYQIRVDLAPLAAAIEQVGEQVSRAANLAVRLTARELQQSWQQQVYRALPIRDTFTQARNAAAVDSITVTDGGPFSATISSSDAAVLGVEQGFPERDLKEMLQTSQRARVSAKGRKYLTIPMRHNTPGQTALAPAMPMAIHAQAGQLAPSTISGKGLRVGANGDVAPKLKYLWGDRMPAGTVPKLKPSHKTDPYAGMVRMNTSNGRQKSSAFMTFRVMHQDSTGWIVPAKPGQWVARDLAQQGQGRLEARIREALKAVGA